MVPEKWTKLRCLKPEATERWYRDNADDVDEFDQWVGNNEDEFDIDDKMKFNEKCWLYASELQTIRNTLFEYAYEITRMRKIRWKKSDYQSKLQNTVKEFGLDYSSKKKAI